MSAGRDEGPVYYREIQKNAYLKRIPNETTSKLLPLGNKKPPLKPMWTLFCVHNGRTPFLEQYPEPESPSTLAHRPVWRACLRTARHVTASVRAVHGKEYDFLVDTDHGPVRMLCPDWESMQDWVTTLRNKLHELKIVPCGENVYCGAPVPAAPRAAARDPTSPLPPTPPVPPDRVPGIELTTSIRPLQTQPTQQTQPEANPEATQSETIVSENRVSEPRVSETNTQPEPENIDISNWEPDSTPSTSQNVDPKKSVAKICGQNICLDDSILKRNIESRNKDSTDSDEEFFAEIDRIHDSVENLNFDGPSDSYKESDKFDYKQRVVVNDKEDSTQSVVPESSQSDRPTNITVIQVSNKPPHTAIPVMGPETNVFNFDFKQNVPVTDNHTDSFVNIVNTEVNVQNGDEYGTVFSKESDYGHISLTTTVNLTEVKAKTDNEGIYERLCMASTSNEKSPLMSKKFERMRNADKIRKSSLPNLDTSDSTYEYLFPNNNENKVTINNEAHSLVLPSEVNSNLTITSSSSNRTVNTSDRSTSSNGIGSTNRNNSGTSNVRNTSTTTVTNTNTSSNDVTSISTSRSSRNVENRSVHVNISNTGSSNNMDLNSRVLRANVERSHSQNAHDRSPRRDGRQGQNTSPKRNGKSEKPEAPPPKPIWKRGLTELSLLSKLRGLGHGKRHDSPGRKTENHDRNVSSPAKVVHRSRPEGRNDTARRRSSSLSNGQLPPCSTALVPLRARQACWLRAEQRRGAATPAAVPASDAPVFIDYNRQVWIAWWGIGGSRCGGRSGDRVAALRGTTPRDAHHARQLVKTSPTHMVDILFHRVPLAKIYVLTKRDREPIGLRLDAECGLTAVEPAGPAARAGLPPPGQWGLTEVNNRGINLVKGGEDEMNRLSLHGTEVSVLIQPHALVKKLRAGMKARQPLLSIR